MTETNRKPAGIGRQKWNLGCLGHATELPMDLVLVKVSIGVKPGPFCMHSGPTEAVTNFGSPVVQTGS